MYLKGFIRSWMRRIGIGSLLPSSIISRHFISVSHGQVMSGPFKGMRLLFIKENQSFLPYLLGTYEMELHETLNTLLTMKFPRIVHIGAGLGYYLLGTAHCSPASALVAYEAESSRRKILEQLSIENNLSGRISIRGFCSPMTLKELLSQNPTPTWLIVDIEGGEKELLDPRNIPGLAYCHILVELHDYLDPSISKTLSERFKVSHRLLLIHSTPRKLSHLPVKFPWPLRWLLKGNLLKAMDEGRPGPMAWLCLTPHEKG